MSATSPQPAAANLSSVEIEGRPALDGRPLLAQDLPRVSSSELHRWISLAQRIRGQFAILARSGDTSIAVTDLSGCYPVFLNDDADVPCRMGTSLESVSAGSRRTLSVAGVSRFIAFGAVGPRLSMVNGVKTLPGASVTVLEGSNAVSTSWFDWVGAATVDDASTEDPEKTFRSLIASWVETFVPKEGRVGLLLSGGTDSGLLLALLKPVLGDRLVCFTQDFFSARYSEASGARETAQRVGVPVTIAKIRRPDHFRAVREMNGARHHAVVHRPIAYNMYCVADFARRQGVNTLINGYNADNLFLGMEYFHDGLPHDREEYQKAVLRMPLEEKLGRVMGPEPVMNDFTRELLGALGIPVAEYQSQVAQARAERRLQITTLAGQTELIKLVQLGNQIEAGVAWQEANSSLGVMKALPGCVLLCPFYDSEIIRLALRLPREFLFHDGRNKYLLRKLLQMETGLERPKRPASMSPTRLWRMAFSVKEFAAVSPELRSFYLGLWTRHIMGRGSQTAAMTKAAALGAWMKSHGVSAPA